MSLKKKKKKKSMSLPHREKEEEKNHELLDDKACTVCIFAFFQIALGW